MVTPHSLPRCAHYAVTEGILGFWGRRLLLP